MRYLALLALALPALAAVNEPCYGPSGAPGVCMEASACTAGGGTTISGACPWDSATVKCCSKKPCLSGDSTSRCAWQSDCPGTSSSGLCPGPSQFKCCNSDVNGWGGYAAPTFPSTSSGCKATAISGAKKVVAAWPGRVRQIYCIRDCACPGTSEHCCGMAIDFMIADGGGYATNSGAQIAEWVMNNRAGMSLKYIIWGQKIWQPSVDAVKSWSSWRTMEDRGSITQNHWDHVHVSYN